MLNWFATTWNEFKTFLWSIVLSVQEMHKDLSIWMFDSFLNISRLALEGVDTYFTGLDVTSYTSSIPTELAWFLNQIGVPQALTMIVTSLTIRLVLQLIPFTRLGS